MDERRWGARALLAGLGVALVAGGLLVAARTRPATQVAGGPGAGSSQTASEASALTPPPCNPRPWASSSTGIDEHPEHLPPLNWETTNRWQGIEDGGSRLMFVDAGGPIEDPTLGGVKLFLLGAVTEPCSTDVLESRRFLLPGQVGRTRIVAAEGRLLTLTAAGQTYVFDIDARAFR